jgi:hypothetical protein
VPKGTTRKRAAKRRRPTAPRTRGEPVLASFINHLSRHVEGFKRLSRQWQHDLAYLAYAEGSWSRRHKLLDDHMTIRYQELERRFGRTGFKEANEAVRMFEVTRQWWKGSKATRGYKLTEAVAKLKAEYLHEQHPRLTHLIQNDGKRLRTIPDAIAAKDIEGRTETFWKGAPITNRVQVDVERLRLLQVRLTALRDDLRAGRGSGDLYVTADLEDVDLHCEMLAKLLRLTRTTAAGIGCVHIRYIKGRTGRLYAQGDSLQTMPRLIRKVALHDLWDYDIENCHYAIFGQMAARRGYEAQAIAAYLADKEATRQGIARRVGVTDEQVKACLLATMYGARASSWADAAIPETLGGPEAAARLYADPEYAAIRRDIQDGRQVILARHPKQPTTILNAAGLRIDRTEPVEALLAHLIQGVEAKALRAAVDAYPDDIVLLMHDGWVSRKQLDRKRLTALMREATAEDGFAGYEFEVSEDRITVPADLDLTNLM